MDYASIVEKKRSRLEELESFMSHPTFFEDAKKAGELMKEHRKLKKLAKTYDYDWEEVAAHMPQHSPLACRKRWEKKQRRKAAAERKEEERLSGSAKPVSQSTLTATADQTIAKEQQIEFLRQNASRLEEKIRMYKEELGRLEMDLDGSQL